MTEPRKAGSLIIARPVEPSPANNYYDYEILLLIRNKSMTFANTVAYPGGKIEPKDAEFLTRNAQKLGLDPKTAGKSLHNLFKLSSIRETFEETGLFFAKEKLQDQSKLKELQKSHQATKSLPDFYSLAEELGIPFENELVEFMRFVTPFIFKHRFDAQFFVYKLDPSTALNIHAGLSNTEELYNLNNLNINLGESSGYAWLNPAQTISKHIAQEFELAPPQIMITNILLSFKKFDDLLNHLKGFRKGVQKDQNGEFPKSYPLTFPISPMFSKAIEEGFKNRGFDSMIIFPYDSKYPTKMVLEKEKSQAWREEFESHNSAISIPPGSKCRHYYKQNYGVGALEEVDISLELDTPIKLLKSTDTFKALFNKPSL